MAWRAAARSLLSEGDRKKTAVTGAEAAAPRSAKVGIVGAPCAEKSVTDLVTDFRSDTLPIGPDCPDFRAQKSTCGELWRGAPRKPSGLSRLLSLTLR